MMRFELGLEKPDPTRRRRTALTIALSYVAGGLVPLALLRFRRGAYGPDRLDNHDAGRVLVFGYIKGQFTTARPWSSAWQTVTVGGLAAAAAFGIAKAVNFG